MLLRISCQLSFDGECEAAFVAYQRLLGGEIRTLLRYSESPLAEQVPAEWQSKILHATLMLEDQELFGSDAFPGAYQRPQGFSIAVSVTELAKAKDLFTSFAEGGQVRMPFQQTFWSIGFGVVVDRFGVSWEVQCEQAPS
jgi:PhnB protein